MPDNTVDPTLVALHRVAVHIVARARVEATGRFSLRVAPGGFATPDFGDGRRVRVSGGVLIVESDAIDAAAQRTVAIDGSSLRQLADLAGVDLTERLDVGRDTPPVGDIETPIALDPVVATGVADWFAVGSAALDRVAAELPGWAHPTLARVWPEHFDVAIEATLADSRVNLGASPGDGYSTEPYLYVGPWGPERPGDQAFWNAPFGAALVRSQLDPDDLVGSAATFLLDGFKRLR